MKIDAELLKKYDVHGPRYTSYPTALQFHEQFMVKDYCAHVEQSNQYPLPIPLSIYLHIPFCSSLCYYCGCHKFITQDHHRIEEYVDYLKQEIALQAALFDRDREVVQIHFGGGTPTILQPQHLASIVDTLKHYFTVSENVEMAIEIDPRTMDDKYMAALCKMKFNRMSFGVQDFNIKVQAAIHRIQDEKATIHLIKMARASGVESISVDIIYGLPQQTLESFKETLATIKRIRPDRIALYHYAHMPDRIKSQNLIKVRELPSSDEKLNILSFSINELTDAGYIHIGIDHFALPNDALSISLKNNTLHRNFQGYSTHGDCDIVGLGVSAISRVDDSFSQNEKILKKYY